ncbi:hypothetical protein G6Z26_15400 [Clostridium perfringens]|uniref:hypothetical protein n=1 Tax=Clostridium perfringens TaxID=1502 RepID=UPI0013E35129|nr:hypothetical protein [Clostridium perfringens]NGT33399.1 hypothetical protein [Clostridium perfringens]NGU11125.1 hypothetical protein [Clostridium perfringens]HAT4073012.1 hypothetical protein [Clostridium perfringens]
MNKIYEEYKKFNIPTSNYNYKSAEEFARNIKKCEMLKEVPIYYTANTELKR